MQRLLIPRKSGLHRAACFALFRALLRQTKRLGLAQPQQATLQSRVRKGFRKNVLEQSPSGILAALRRGHALLRVLHEGIQKPLNSSVHVFDFATIPIIRASSLGSRNSALDLNVKPKATDRKRRGPMVWPRPNTPSIFERPFPKVSGRRRVPRLVCTSGFPFLLIKKPQSQFLGRIIRDDLRQYQKRTILMWKLRDQIKLADDEDRWEQILQSTCGLKIDEAGGSWEKETSSAKHQVMLALFAHRQKRLNMAQKMQEIVEKEQALADLESRQRKTEKRKERIRRRLDRKAADDAGVAAQEEVEIQVSATGSEPAKAE